MARQVMSSPVAGLLAQSAAAEPLNARSSLHGASVMFGPKQGQVCPKTMPAFDGDGFNAFLRRHHPRKTAAHVAAETGISEETVRNWLKQVSRPSVLHVLALYAVFGASVLAAMWSGRLPAVLDAAKLEEERAAVRAEQAKLAERMAALEARR